MADLGSPCSHFRAGKEGCGPRRGATGGAKNEIAGIRLPDVRYRNHDGYVVAVAREAHKLQQRRLLLPEDVQRYIDAAQASDVLH